ncbi:phage terminase large subunit [Tardiphaga sp.]|jgi:predicted phage terminase large subunit-like protein|uniref:phage terminase large subunit n=1 Tax=Tardiphaga sp. TaxID=1926292 RepID=UPI0037DA1475
MTASKRIAKDNPKDFYRSLLRTDFEQFLHRSFRELNPGADYMPNWHMRAIAHSLEQIRSGEITRLIINLPPRYLKSMMTSVVFPAFLLGQNPRLKIFGVSYADDLSAKHASDFRALVESDWYRDVFPKMRVKRAADSDIFTTQRGFRRSTTVNSALTGLGGDIFIIDDPQKPIDAQSEANRNRVNSWFSNTLRSRLDNKETGVIILVMQRVHMNDLTGHLLEHSDGWTVLNLPAIAEDDEEISIGTGEIYKRKAGEALHPAYESLETLRTLQREVGSEVFAAQYQQAPVPSGGAMIRREWFKYYDFPPPRTPDSRIIQSWDTAVKDGTRNDWSVCTTWQVEGKHFYLLNVSRGRFEYPQLRDKAIALGQAFNPHTILVEDAMTGAGLIQELRQAGNFNMQAVKVEHNKANRLWLQQAKFEAGLVHFPRSEPWLKDLETELLMFPQGKHDDQVDSVSQALAFKSTYDVTLSWVDKLESIMPDEAKIWGMYNRRLW